MQARSTPLKNALLSDVCISTSAAPTYLPAHYFKTQDAGGKAREYNLIDGGVAANNPAIDRMQPEPNKSGKLLTIRPEIKIMRRPWSR